MCFDAEQHCFHVEPGARLTNENFGGIDACKDWEAGKQARGVLALSEQLKRPPRVY